MGVFRARAMDAALDPAQSSITPIHDHPALVRFAAAVAFCVAVLILLGWAGDFTLLKSGLSGQRATQPLSAICCALCSISLGLSAGQSVLSRYFTRGCALIVAAVVIATVWQNALDVDWGLDRFLFPGAVVHQQIGSDLRPGRPSAGTLVALGLLSFSLLLIRARSGAARTLFIWLATTAALLGATVVLVYAFSLTTVYAMGFYASVGLSTGIELTLLGCGVLLLRSDLGWVRLLSGNTAGASSARCMLLWSGLLLLVLAGIVRLGQSAALYGAGFEMTLLIVGGFAVFLAALSSHAQRINSLETIRRSVATDLHAAETRLASAAHEQETQLTTLARELRHPLTPLRNGVEIVRQMSGANPLLARTAEMMARQVMQLIRLADDLVDIRPSTPIEPPGTATASVESSRLKILVADDNADGADSLAMLLQAQGHMVLTASDGRRAVELAEVFLPDVILMDVAMPHLDGLQATREIRLRPWGVGVRIVAVTAWGQESERRRTLEAGMDFHLVKPVDPQTLAAVLRQGRR